MTLEGDLTKSVDSGPLIIKVIVDTVYAMTSF